MAFDVMVPLKEGAGELDLRQLGAGGRAHRRRAGASRRVPTTSRPVQCRTSTGLTRPTFALRSMEMLDDVILALRKMHQPVIAAVNGAAIGGGLCLALAADIRVAASGAYFRAAGINNGLTASELGLSYLLPRAIGSSRAFEIMLTGRDIDADEAERIGLVSRQVPEDQLLDTCYEMAERIASFSRPGVELTKRTLWSGLDAGSLEGHMQAEGLGQLFVRLLTANFEEAVAARAEKRPPVVHRRQVTHDKESDRDHRNGPRGPRRRAHVALRRRPGAARAARRPHRAGRAQRRRQDHHPAHPGRRGRAVRGHGRRAPARSVTCRRIPKRATSTSWPATGCCPRAGWTRCSPTWRSSRR